MLVLCKALMRLCVQIEGNLLLLEYMSQLVSFDIKLTEYDAPSHQIKFDGQIRKY